MGCSYGPEVRSHNPRAHRRLLAGGLLLVLTAAVSVSALLGGGGDRSLEAIPVLSAADLATIPTYKVRTVLDRPGQTPVERVVTGVIGVPTLVDVHQSGQAGFGVPDLIVSVLPRLPLGVGLNITRTPLLAPPMPVRVEVEWALPNAGGRTLAVGYDGRSSSNPRSFDADVQFGLLPGQTTIGLTTRMGNVPPRLDLLAALFTRTSDGSRVDPTDVTLTAAPTPTRLDALATFTPGLASFSSANDATVAVRATSNTTFHATAVAHAVEGGTAKTFDIDVPQLPRTIALTHRRVESDDRTEVTLDPDGPIASVTAGLTKVVDGVQKEHTTVGVTGVPDLGTVTIDGAVLAPGVVADEAPGIPDGDPNLPVDRSTVTWAGSDVVPTIVLASDRLTPKGEPVHVAGTVTGLPRNLTLELDRVGPTPPAGTVDERPFVIDAFPAVGQTVGRIEAGIGTTAEAVPFRDPTTPAYASLVAAEDPVTGAPTGGAAVQIEALTHLAVDTRDEVTIDLDTARAQALDVEVDTPRLDVDAVLRELPTDSLVVVDGPEVGDVPEVTHVSYVGSAPISTVDGTVRTVIGEGDDARGRDRRAGPRRAAGVVRHRSRGRAR